MSESSSIRNQYQLGVVKKGKELAKLIYGWCNRYLPEKEKFGLWSQMTRCAVSVPSNIAEGQQRGGKDFIRFIQISRGSLKELEVQLDIASELYVVNPTEAENFVTYTHNIYLLIDEIGKMTHSLILKLKADTQ